MKYVAKLRPHPDGKLCWWIYRPVRSCMLRPRHMFLAPVLFSSGLPYPLVVCDGAWWLCSSWCHGFPGLWVSGPTGLGGQAHWVRGQSPSEVLLLQVYPQKFFIRSHTFQPQLRAVDPFTSTLHEVSRVSRGKILERSGGSACLPNLSKLRTAALGAIILA